MKIIKQLLIMLSLASALVGMAGATASAAGTPVKPDVNHMNPYRRG